MRKKKNKRAFTENSQEIYNVRIPTYAPNLGLQPVDYLMSPQMKGFSSNFEEKCKEFIKNTNLDEYNGSYFDAVIEKVCNEAIVNLTLQRADHVSVITTLLEKMWMGDRIKIEAKLEQAIVEVEAVEKRIRKFERICWKDTNFIEEEEEDYE